MKCAAIKDLDCNEELLRKAIAQQSPATVYLRNGNSALSLRVVLLKPGECEGDQGIWAKLSGDANELIDKLIEAGAPVLVTMSEGPRELSFVSSLLTRRKTLRGEQRVLLSWPAAIKSQERRRTNRETISPFMSITAMLIQSGDHAFPTVSVRVQLVDLGTQGACVVCRPNADSTPQAGQELRLRLIFEGFEHLLHTRLLRIETEADGEWRLRMEFLADRLRTKTADHLASLLERLRSHRVLRELNGAITKGTW